MLGEKLICQLLLSNTSLPPIISLFLLGWQLSLLPHPLCPRRREESNKPRRKTCLIGFSGMRHPSCCSCPISACLLPTMVPNKISGWSRVQQKISGTFRSQTGPVAFCRIRGYFSTMAKQGFRLFLVARQIFAGVPLSPLTALSFS